MKFHDTLNDKIWDLNTEDLIPEVKEKLEEIAEAFIEFLEIPTDAVLDKVITGSSASYNYNKYSDLDLHIIVDYDKVHEDCPLVNGYLNSLKKQFNDNHDITIHGVPVELYAEQKDQGTVHNGLYSLQTGWIDKPQKIAPTDNDAAVEAKFNEIKELVDKCDDSEEATELLEKIYNMRKAGLAEAGEFCTENLAFKKLRNEGCMDKLRQIKKEQIDKQLSLESYNEDYIDDLKFMLRGVTENSDQGIKQTIINKLNELPVGAKLVFESIKGQSFIRYEEEKITDTEWMSKCVDIGEVPEQTIIKTKVNSDIVLKHLLENTNDGHAYDSLNQVNESIKEGFNKGDKVQLKRKNNKIGIVKSIFNGDKDKNDKDIKYLDVEFEDGTKEGRPASDFRKVNESIKESEETKFVENPKELNPKYKVGDYVCFYDSYDQTNRIGKITRVNVSEIPDDPILYYTSYQIEHYIPKGVKLSWGGKSSGQFYYAQMVAERNILNLVSEEDYQKSCSDNASQSNNTETDSVAEYVFDVEYEDTQADEWGDGFTSGTLTITKWSDGTYSWYADDIDDGDEGLKSIAQCKKAYKDYLKEGGFRKIVITQNESINKLEETLKRVKDMEINEGMWASPFTMENAKQIAELLAKPITYKELDSEEGKQKVWNIIGDDEFWDNVADEALDNPEEDARYLIVKFLEDWMERKESFNDDAYSQEAENIIKKAIFMFNGITEDMATLEKKVDTADNDLHDIITSLENSIKEALE